jgi:hypothetical protein
MRIVADEVRVEGETPLEYMLRVMRNNQADEKRRDMMAVAAAPFLHPKLAAVEHSGNDEKPLTIEVVSGVTRIIDAHELDGDSANEARH